MPTAQDWQSLLLLEVGASLEGDDAIDKILNDKVTPNLPTIWAMWQDKALVFPRLQYLYVKRHCLQIIMGQLRDFVDTSLGTNLLLKQSSYMNNLHMMHDMVSQDIANTELMARRGRPSVIGELLKTSPSEPANGPDPSNPVYRGDALVRPNIVDGLR